MPPSDNDGKTSAPSPASPLADSKMGADDFDWDKAIDEWDPTFIADNASALPPEMSGVVVASLSNPGLPAVTTPNPKISDALPVDAAPPPKAPPVTGPPSLPPPPVDADVAPLPPPPLETAPALQIDIDLTSAPPPYNPEATLHMDAADLDRLADLLRRPEPVSPSTEKTLIPSEPPADDEDFYDVVFSQSESSKSLQPRSAQITPVPSVETPRPSAQTPPTIPGSLAAQAAVESHAPPAAVTTAQPEKLPEKLPDPPAAPAPAITTAPTVTPTVAQDVAPIAAPIVDSKKVAAAPAAMPVVDSKAVAAAPAAVPIVDSKKVAAAPVAMPVVDSKGVAAAPVAMPIVDSKKVAAAPTPISAEPSLPMAPVAPPPSLADVPKAPAAPVPLVVRRLPLPAFDILPLPTITKAGGTSAPEAATRRHFLSLLDAEAAHHAPSNKRRAARLAVSAAHQSEALREPADALDRYRTALEADPQHRPAMRGTRRVLSWPGPTSQPDEASQLLDRELERSTPSERQGLVLTRSELLRAQGLNAEAKQSYQDALPTARKGAKPTAQPGGMAALCGLLDIAFVQSSSQEVLSALDSAIELYATQGSLRTVMQIERARLDEAAGRDSAAATRYEALFGAGNQGSLTAGLGWLRTAVRLPRAAQGSASPLSRAYQALLSAQLPLGLRSAVRRQLALAQPAGSAERTTALAAPELGSDWLVLEDLALGQEQAGDFAAAGASYAKLAESTREPLQLYLALTNAGENFLRAGNIEAAGAALLQAQQVAAAADLDYDAIVGRTLERLSRRISKPEELLALLSTPTGQSGEKAAFAHYQAAQMLLKLPADDARRTTALPQLQAALQARADYAPAVQLLVEHFVADGKPAEAARVLLRAAEAVSDRVSRSESLRLRGYAEEAARLFTQAGEPVEAARVLIRELGGGQSAGAASLLPALRWQLSSLVYALYGKADSVLAEQVADVLKAEAEQTTQTHRAAALWYQRGALLWPHQPTSSPALGAVEQSFQRALEGEPLHGPALLGLHLRALLTPTDTLAHSPLAHTVVDALRVRMEQSAGRPEAMLWALRLGAAQEQEAADAGSALVTYKHLRTFAPDHSALIGLEDTLFITAWRAGQAFELVEKRLQTEQDSDQRYALLILAGEQLERQSQSQKAAERFEQALELRPGHPVAKAALVRAYQSAGMLDELARFTAAELKEATDVQTRVAAYERQALLATLRGGDDSVEQAINAYRNVLNIDTNNHAAMRALERHFISSAQWAELVHLYEQMGLCATDTAFGVHIHLDRARLRQRLAWQEKGDDVSLNNELENDFRLAVYRDRHSRPALRYLLNAALRKGELGQIATMSTRIAEVSAVPGDFPGTEAGDGRSAAVFMTRAAEALAADGRPHEEVIAAFQQALKYSREHLPALRGLLHYSVLCRQFQVTAETAEALAQHLHDTDERYLHYMLAGVVSQELLKDLPRAQRAFLAGMRLNPRREEAFERLRAAYSGQTETKEGATALAALIEERLRDHADSPAYQSTLRLELAQLLAGPLGNRARAKSELRTAAEQTPSHANVLYALGKLLSDDEEWAPAVELLERYGEVETRPSQLVALSLLLSDIYQNQLKDAQRALVHYTKVLQLQPQNQLALGKVADLFMAQNKPAGALPILRRLVKYTDEKPKKIAFYHRIAALSELSGDNRGALEALRQAVDVDPMHMPALGELAKFYDRQKDTQSMRILLDRTATRFRPLLREKPRDVTVLQTLLQIFLWKKSRDHAAMTAAILSALGGTVPAELRAEVDKLPARKEPTRDGMRDSNIDDVLYPSRVAPGLRALLRMLAEPLTKLYGTDAKKLAAMGVDKRERLPKSGHPVRDLANKLAAEMGVGEFDIYVTAAQRKEEDGRKFPYYTIEPTDPPSLIITSSLLEGSETEKRFLLSGLLMLLKSNLVLPLSMTPDELGLLVGGLVRQFVPNYTPLGYAEKRIANEAARLKKAIPSKLHGQLLPYAMECSAESLDFEGVADTLQQSAYHIGLVLTSDIASAINAIRRKGSGSDRDIDGLIRFAVSDEYAELRRLITGG